jgi:hypothetical protein
MTVAWDFGDGNTATAPIEEPVTHTYLVPGDHPVTATVGSRPAEGATAAARSRNLLPSDDAASLEGGQPYTSYNSSLSRTTERAVHGEHSLRIILSGFDGQARGPVTPADIDVSGRRLTLMASFWAVDSPSRVSLRYWNMNAAGGQISGGTVQAFDSQIPAGEWVAIRVEIDARVDAPRGRLVPGLYSGGTMLDVDRLGIFFGSVASQDWSLPSEFQP